MLKRKPFFIVKDLDIMLHKFLNKLDKIICNYLGLIGNEDDRPRSIKIINNKIFIYKNAPFQRLKSVESWKHFNDHGVQQADDINKQKIGIAAGKIIAKNLTISFDNIEVKVQ
jgi:hypothetical protein